LVPRWEERAGEHVLCKPRLLLCDEATANIDLVTDERVHAVLMGLDATVLMICHRMHAIEDFDHVVFMDKGQVAEAGAPRELLRRPDGRLAALVGELVQ
jgi:ABC-type multidrug transport system fused ATPase/permease subunit